MSGFIEREIDNRLYYNHITSLKLQSYEFAVHYAEELNSKVAEFPKRCRYAGKGTVLSGNAWDSCPELELG